LGRSSLLRLHCDVLLTGRVHRSRGGDAPRKGPATKKAACTDNVRFSRPNGGDLT